MHNIDVKGITDCYIVINGITNIDVKGITIICGDKWHNK